MRNPAAIATEVLRLLDDHARRAQMIARFRRGHRQARKGRGERSCGPRHSRGPSAPEMNSADVEEERVARSTRRLIDLHFDLPLGLFLQSPAAEMSSRPIFCRNLRPATSACSASRFMSRTSILRERWLARGARSDRAARGGVEATRRDSRFAERLRRSSEHGEAGGSGCFSRWRAPSRWATISTCCAFFTNSGCARFRSPTRARTPRPPVEFSPPAARLRMA